MENPKSLEELAIRLLAWEHTYLERRIAVGDCEETEDNQWNRARQAAAYTLLEICNALPLIHPLFSAREPLAPLQDVIHGLGDVMTGGKPPLFQAPRGVGVGKDGFELRYIKRHALVGVALLRSLGLNDTNARGTVAKEMKTAGVVGRKGGPLSPKTIREWEDSADDALRRRIADDVDEFGAILQPLSPEKVGAWLKQVWCSNFMQAKI